MKAEINFTEEVLKSSKEFAEWVTGKVALIHNTYYDSKEPYASYIVLHSDMGKWTITRFFEMGGNIHVSNDHVDISTKEVFKLLLTSYSRGLN
jgi:hypothetical protein